MEETESYVNNNIGLKYLDIRKKLKTVTLDGMHNEFTEADIDNIFIPFLKDW